jgi:hypothetical protein
MTDINIHCNGDSFIAKIETLDYPMPNWPEFFDTRTHIEFAKDLYNKYIK